MITIFGVWRSTRATSEEENPTRKTPLAQATINKTGTVLDNLRQEKPTELAPQEGPIEDR